MIKNRFAGPILSTDYTAGAHPAVFRALSASNLENTPGYGTDHYCTEAAAKIRRACRAPKAEVFFLTGGTQTNALTLDALLKPYEGVLAAETGHIAVHEAGAVEFTGHKVLTLPAKDGKIAAESILSWCENFYADEAHEHMVFPGVIYLSQPTEYGTLYSLAELEEIREAADRYGLKIYADGARLAYALACPENDVSLPDLARLCDAFYIGGTKCGALFGEALVIPKPAFVPHLFTIIKQHGALLAKGRITGLQFDTLFTGSLYDEIGKSAIEAAARIRSALLEKGYTLAFPSPTNQIFITLEKEQAARHSEKIETSFWENTADGHTVMRICTSWATQQEEVDRLIAAL